MSVMKKENFQKKLMLKVLYLNSTNGNFISLIEGVISIKALPLWTSVFHMSSISNRQIKQAKYPLGHD